MAMPCPPPMHAEPMPYFSPFLLSLWTRWAEMREPEAARGWPRATAPPQVLNFSRGMSRAFWQESACAANASLISTFGNIFATVIHWLLKLKTSTWSTSPILTPVFSSIACVFKDKLFLEFNLDLKPHLNGWHWANAHYSRFTACNTVTYNPEKKKNDPPCS